jgi:hypothetical protein
MCHIVYIAADVDLPLVAGTDPPTFSVVALDPSEDAVRRHLGDLPQVRELGSATGCGCDFHADEGDASRQRLVAYLGALPPHARIVLYSCWQSEWAGPVEETLRLPLSVLVQADAFADHRLIIVQRP